MVEEVVTTPGTPAVAGGINEPFVPVRFRVSWGAIFGGVFAALGVWLLFYAFGLAVGLSSVDPNNPGSVKGSGIFEGIWGAIVTPLVALFVGGVVAGRLAGLFSRSFGALYGLVTWGLVTVFGAYAAVSLVSSALSGAAAVGRTVAEGGAAVVKGAAGAAAGAAGGLNLDWNDVVGPVNARLRAQGKPTVTAGELRAATRDSLESAAGAGRFDRNTVVNALAQNTSLSRADAQDVAARVEAQLDAAKSRLTQGAQGVAAKARTGALKAADMTGKAFWGVFVALILGLIAAVVGGAVGVPGLHAKERPARGPRARTAEPPPERGPIVPPREAYPRT